MMGAGPGLSPGPGPGPARLPRPVARAEGVTGGMMNVAPDSACYAIRGLIKRGNGRCAIRCAVSESETQPQAGAAGHWHVLLSMARAHWQSDGPWRQCDSEGPAARHHRLTEAKWRYHCRVLAARARCRRRAATPRRAGHSLPGQAGTGSLAALRLSD